MRRTDRQIPQLVLAVLPREVAMTTSSACSPERRKFVGFPVLSPFLATVC